MLSNVMWWLHGPEKMRSPTFLLHEVRSRWIFLVSVLLNCRMGMSSPRAVEVKKNSRNVQVSRPLLELRGRHVAVLQMKVPQVALVRQLYENVSESFTFCLFARNRGILCSLMRVLRHLLFQCGSWVLPYWRSFSSSHGCSWRRSWRNQGCKVSVISSWFTLFLRRFFPWCRLHKRLVILHHQRQRYGPAAQGSLIFIFVHVLCRSWICWVFALTRQRLHVSLGDQIAHATWSLGDSQDSSSPTQYVPLWSTQLEMSAGQKLDM